LSDQRVTTTSAPNFAYSIVQRRLSVVDDGAYDLSALRYAICGAEPVDPVTMAEFTRQAARFGMRDTAIIAAYGLAEATLAVPSPPTGQPLAGETVCAEELEKRGRGVPASDAEAPGKDLVLLGRPISGLEARVVSQVGATLPARSVGEILIRGEMVAR